MADKSSSVGRRSSQVTMGASNVGSGNMVGDEDGTREGVNVSVGGTSVGVGVGVAMAIGKTVAVTLDV